MLRRSEFERVFMQKEDIFNELLEVTKVKEEAQINRCEQYLRVVKTNDNTTEKRYNIKNNPLVD